MQRGIMAAMLAVLGLVPAWASGAGTLPDTGQTDCYGTGRLAQPCAGALAGQDGQVLRHPPRYRDGGDGTVTDLVTGLMWQQGFTRAVAWRDAPSLAAQARTAGHADWRVPSIKELYSLMDFSGNTGSGGPNSGQVPADARPYLNPVFAFEYPSAPLRFIDAQYISATAYSGLTGRMPAFFGVNFADGRIKGYPQNGGPGGRGWYLRLVRGPAYGQNDFQDNGDGTVTDRAFGLTWQQADSGQGMDWPQALAYCHGLTLGGAADWRLPNAKELQSLVDYGRSPQATGTAALSPLLQASPITNEAGRPDFPAYWTSTTHLDGPQQGANAVTVHFGEALGIFGQQGPGGGGMGGPPGMGPRGGPPGMGPMGGPPGMRGGRQGSASDIVDVHGAGAQRSDPKTGSRADYPQWGHGPQGDVRRVFNHVRCVRG